MEKKHVRSSSKNSDEDVSTGLQFKQKLLEKEYAIEKLQGIVGTLEKKVKDLESKDKRF